MKSFKKLLLVAVASSCISLPALCAGSNATLGNSHGQVWDGQFAPDSPETVSMLRYGDGRPDLYSGQMSMSIPIYTWKDNLFEIPVSLGYSYSGFKPGFTDSTVGLGWFLNAGGVITREVRGIPDESWNLEFPACEQLLDMYRESRGDIRNHDGDEEDHNVESSDPTGEMNPSLTPGNPYNGAAMHGFLYLYNSWDWESILSPQSSRVQFLYTGSPACEFSAGLKIDDYHCVEAEPDIFRFSFMGMSGSFILQPGHRVLILESSVPAGTLDISFNYANGSSGTASTFVITTGDKVRYTFQARSSSKSIEYINGADMGGDSDTWTGWKLIEIRHPSGRKVTFDYAVNTISNTSAAKSRDHMSVNAAEDQGVGGGSLPVHNWQDAERNDETAINKVIVNDSNVTRITIEDRGHIDFTYDESGLSAITVWAEALDGAPERLLKEATLTHMAPLSVRGGSRRCSDVSFLTGVSISGEGSYSFQYSGQEGHFPDGNDVSELYKTDWYGYYNEESYVGAYYYQSMSVYNHASAVLQARSSHSFARSVLGAMTRVTYPAGGYSDIMYESNKYRRVSGSSTDPASDQITGGVRVRSVSVHDSDGEEISRREYLYEEEGGASSGVLLQQVGINDIYFVYTWDNKYRGSEFRMNILRESSIPGLSLGYGREHHVEYLRVIEEVREGSSLKARTEHRFHSASSYIEPSVRGYVESQSGSSRFSAEMADVFECSYDPAWVSDWRMRASNTLAGREYYTKEHALGADGSSLETATTYGFYDIEPSYPGTFIGLGMFGGKVYERSYVSRLERVSEETSTLRCHAGAPFERWSRADVDTLGRVITVTESTSSDDDLVTRYTYDDIAPSLVSSLVKRRGGRLISREDMEYHAPSWGDTLCRLPSVLYEHAVDSLGRDRGRRAKLTFGPYDRWCNPASVTDAAGRTTSWTWGYAGLHPVAKETRGGLLMTQRSEWTWIPMVGVSAFTDPYGTVKSYEYDGYGRLSAVRNGERELLAENVYNICTSPLSDCAPFTSSRNFIATRKHIDTDLVKVDVDYYDGLGRPSQSIAVEAGSGWDVVTQTGWDALGRKTASHLPFASSGSGAYVAGWEEELDSYYSGVGLSRPGESLHAATTYEDRLSGRMLSTTLPGDSFQAHPSLTSYRTNSAGEIRRYTYASWFEGISYEGSYAAGELLVTRHVDGDGRVSESFSDKEGREVCVRRYVTPAVAASTYKVYDERGALAWVITPEGSEAIGASSPDMSSEAALKCYIYSYDRWGRMISKTVPGHGTEQMVYDRAGRVVLWQDANLHLAGQWRYTTYNTFDDVTATYLVSCDSDRQCLQEMFPVDSQSTFRLNSYVSTRLSVTHYNEQGLFATSSSVSFAPESGVVSRAELSDAPNRKCHEEMILTGSQDVTVSRDYYYDREGRVIQVAERNHLGGISRTSFRYDLAGNVLESVERHTTGGSDTSDDVKHSLFQYDGRGRLIYECSTLNNGEIASAEYTFNRIGQSRGDILGDGEYGVRENLEYTLQGWLGRKTASSYAGVTLFQEELRYDAPSGGTPLYTGNISSVSVTHMGSPVLTRMFSYDGMGRLMGSESDGDTPLTRRRLCESGISYDRNGNMLSLQRFAEDGTALNDYTYTYDDDLLIGVDDAADSQSFSFTYDANGNLVADGMRGLQISYNFLNLPSIVTNADMRTSTEYTYTSDGVKCSVMRGLMSGQVYLGSLVYKVVPRLAGGVGGHGGHALVPDYVLESASFGKGRIVGEGGSFVARYFITDHLGSTCCVTHGEEGDDAPVYEQSLYYPFGMRVDAPMSGDVCAPMTVANRWRFSGKEEQTLMGEDLLDFGARFYDSRLGRWTTTDPLAEKYYSVSPYAYCAGNPVAFVDPDGRKVVISGELANEALSQIQSRVGSKISLKLGDNGELSYSTSEEKLRGRAKRLAKIIDNQSITVNIKTQHGKYLDDGRYIVGGAFMGNTVSNTEGKRTVVANQVVNPLVLAEADKSNGKSGTFMFHELTEAYEGAKISLRKGESSKEAGLEGSVYERAHARASFQPDVKGIYTDKDGNEVLEKDAVFRMWFVLTPSEEKHTIETIP